MYIILSLLFVGLLLIINELWWSRHKTHEELPRKLIHIIVGSFVAFWPFYISWNWIRIISLAFLLGVVLSKGLNIFASIHEVERFSVGEICFALAVGGLTFITKTDWIYTAALLQMSIADGLAAIVGVRFGRNNQYKVLGATKSFVGSAAFFISSIFILIVASGLAKAHLSFLTIVLTALIAMVVEVVAVYGLDNLFLPLVVVFILNQHLF